MSKGNKTMFTAVFKRYEYTDNVLEQVSYFTDIRTRDGSLVKKFCVFDESTTGKIEGHLTLGEYVAFLADVEFKDIEFCRPHGKN